METAFLYSTILGILGYSIDFTVQHNKKIISTKEYYTRFFKVLGYICVVMIILCLCK